MLKVIFVIAFQEKQESWWVYIVARKNQSLITPPQTVLSLKDTEEVNL